MQVSCIQLCMRKIRRGFYRNILALAGLVCGIVLQSLAQVPVSEIARRVDDRYNHMNTLRAQFTEEYQGAGMTRSETGALILKKPGKMRWEYSVPQEKLFVSDGKTAYFYVPGEQQARKTDVKKLDDLRSPLRYLLGKAKLEKELAALSLAPEQTPMTTGNWILRGVPKSMGDQVADVLLEINSQYEIVRILIHENDGSTTEFRFSNLKENVPAEDGLFGFKPPQGVEVVEDKSFAP